MKCSNGNIFVYDDECQYSWMNEVTTQNQLQADAGASSPRSQSDNFLDREGSCNFHRLFA